MYLDAKYHIRKDIKVIHALRKIEAARAVASEKDTTSVWECILMSFQSQGKAPESILFL